MVSPWHELVGDVDLTTTVATLLTEPVTRSLPEEWRGDFSLDRAQRWIAERDGESPTLVAVDKTTMNAVGLVMLFESPGEPDGRELRIGYLLGERHWGQGLASELVAGLVGWARSLSTPITLVGGVEVDNVASARVLTKNTFQLVSSNDSIATYSLQTFLS